MSDESSSIRATRIGGHAHRYLATRPCEGQVVSSFSGGINLLFEDGEAFVPVQTSAVPLHPWAVQVSGHLLRADESTQASFAGEEIEIGDTIVSLGNAKVEHLRLPRISNEEAKIALSRLPLLAQFIVECRKTRSSDPFQPQIEAIFAAGMKVVRSTSSLTSSDSVPVRPRPVTTSSSASSWDCRSWKRFLGKRCNS